MLDSEELAAYQADLKTKPQSIQDHAPPPGLAIQVRLSMRVCAVLCGCA